MIQGKHLLVVLSVCLVFLGISANKAVCSESVWSYSPPACDRQGGVTLVPLRALLESLGMTFHYNAAKKMTTITLGTRTINVITGLSFAYVNGHAVHIDAPVCQRHGITYVPLRFVGEALGCLVHWDERSKRATISYDESNPLPLRSVPQAANPVAQTGNPVQQPATFEQQAINWVKFKCVEGRFTADFPGAPHRKTSPFRVLDSDRTLNEFICDKGDRCLFAEYVDLQREIVTKADVDRILDSSRDGAAAKVGGKITTATDGIIDGHPTRDFIVQIPGKTLVNDHVRIFIVGNRLYIFQSLWVDGITDMYTQHFFDSIHVD